MLNGALPHFDDKFEAVVAVDTAMAIIETFHESHQMAAHHLLNMYLHKDMQDYLPDVVLVTIYSLMLNNRQPPHDQPVSFYAMLLSQCVE